MSTDNEARLRGDGEQRQAVAWIKPDWSDPKNFDGKSPVTTYPQLGWTPLYIHPQSAPSEQVAASVPCAFRSLLAEARRQYCDSDAAGDVLAWLDERVLETDYAAPVVTDAMVETVGSALFKYWNDVNEECRGKYRERVRAALEQALKGT